MIYGIYEWIVAWLDDDMNSTPDELLTIMTSYDLDPFSITKKTY